MKYQYQIVAANSENETVSIHFNHLHAGWLTLPKDESKALIKFLKARHTNKVVEKTLSFKKEVSQ